MKKILSLILAGLMTVSCAAFVAADDAAVEATTDPVQDYAIEFLANCGVFKGGEGLTNEDLIQRYQMALFVSRISTGWVEDSVWEDGTANDATFKDIDTEPANKYLGALSYANQNGIIEGYTANTFAPYASITYRDALTMVVRTLGYKGLSYPWGNIEKAVELGLTEGIDAAYTDELTRGEVAVIIYNAMFAKNSKGETLAKSIFGYDFGFQNIVIVSTDEYGYGANGDRAAAGYVGFKTIDENGVLGSKVYYVKASEFGFEGHAEELAVGEVFVALFEIDGDYTNMIDVASMKTATVMNNGITDNEGKAYETMPIAAALADYTLVKDYTKGILNYTYDDLRVYAYQSVDVIDADGNAAYVGIDANHNIVKWTVCSESTHGADNADCKCAWEIAWFYNAELDRYYDYIVDAENAKVDADGKVYEAIAGNVYINWMSDAEFTEWYNGAIKKVLASYYELTLQEAPAAALTNGKAPYAKLNLFNIDEDAQAEIATYKSYSIGIISKDTANYKCYLNKNNVDHSAGVVMPAYVITDLDGGNKDYVFVEEGHTAHDVDLTKGFGWLNVDESVTTFDEAKGGVVLYNWNKTTGEIEIVKHITEGTNDDADSKIITGVLQAYSTKNKTVTIDGTVYPIDYDNLAGDMYAMANTEPAARKVVGAILDAQYMQYITAVVCDGYVVDTDLRGNDSDFIVVLGYAGITSDGYIAVYGYKTDDLSMKVYKINTYNGWKKGDYRYYPENATEDAAFAYGALYQVKSYDAETDSYGVYTENVSSVLEGATPVQITFQDGYRSVQPATIKYDNVKKTYSFTAKGDPTIYKMTTGDKYVIVTDMGQFSVGSNIHVYDGIVDDNGDYTINALMVVGDGNSKTLVLYTPETSTIFTRNSSFYENAYEVGYVLYEKDNGIVLDAAYDEAIAGNYYLLGSTLSEVTVMNLLTGKKDAVLASSNIDLVNGHIYKTIGGQILWDVTDECNGNLHTFMDEIWAAYDSTDLDYADYVVNTVTFDKSGLTDAYLYNRVTGKTVTTATDKVIADKLIHNDRLIYLVEDVDAFDWYGYHGMTEISALTLEDKTTYTGYVIYDVATTKTVVYVFAEETGSIVVDTSTVKTATNAAAPDYLGLITLDDRNFDVAAVFEASAKFDGEDCQGDMSQYKLNKIELSLVEAKYNTTDKKWEWFDLSACATDGAMHNALAAKGAGFGSANVDDTVIVYIDGDAAKVASAVETCLDCGLAHKLVITLSENNYLEYFAASEVIVNINGVDVAKITLEAEYILNEPTEHPDYGTFDCPQHGSSCTGVASELVAVNVLGEDGINLNAKAPVSDSITILG